VTEQRAPRREGKVRRRDLGVSYGQLADLLRAGVPLLRALETIAKAGVKPAVQRVLLGLRDDVSAGDALADAMGTNVALAACAALCLLAIVPAAMMPETKPE